MVAIQGYFDGTNIKPLERLVAKPNQRVIITVLDEYVEPVKALHKKGIRGILAQYADPTLAKQEKGACERSMVEKYGNRCDLRLERCLFIKPEACIRYRQGFFRTGNLS